MPFISFDLITPFFPLFFHFTASSYFSAQLASVELYRRQAFSHVAVTRGKMYHDFNRGPKPITDESDTATILDCTRQIK